MPCNFDTATPKKTPSKPKNTELATWPSPQRKVMKKVLKRDHLPACDITMKGR
jgi:hypothetical protein